MARYIKAKPYLITERKKTQPKPSRLALYGRLIEKYLNRMFLADMVGDMGKSVEMACKIGEVITRMKREENQ